jgi:hypothetical protein
MFSKFAALSAAALTFLGPFAASSALAQVPMVVTPTYHFRHAYFVEFRPHGHMPWQVSGPFGSPRHAHHMANSLRVQGFHARVIYR